MIKKNDPIIITSFTRTPIGKMQGMLSSFSASHLGGITLSENIKQAKINPEMIDEVIMGCVLQAGIGQAPARQAAINASIPYHVGATTINKMCGSGLKAIMLGFDSINSNSNKIILAGGMESMTNAPYLLPKARTGHRLGHDKIYDHMFLDGLEDPYNNNKLMGEIAEKTAEKYNFTKEEQDNFAINSLIKSKAAIKSNLFKNEIVNINIKNKNESLTIEQDEIPIKLKTEKIPLLKPAFMENGTITAASSSAIADGAASLLLMKESTAKKLSLKPIAKILAHASFSTDPIWFTEAPIGAIKKLLAKLNLNKNNIDLFEINEAFAAVTMATMKSLDLDQKKVNIFGGACALGHPIGATGARITCTLINALKQKNKKLGIASLCIGGGEAVAIAIENL